jgi:hypothetical protein
VRGAVSIFQFDIGFVSFLDVSYDFDSAVLPLSGAGGFAGNAVAMGVEQALIAFDGLVVSLISSQPVADSPGALFGPFEGLNAATGAAVTTPDPIGNPMLRRLSIPVNLPLSIVLEGVPLTASASGTITAFALVPEPTTLLLVGGGMAGLAALGRRRS